MLGPRFSLSIVLFVSFLAILYFRDDLSQSFNVTKEFLHSGSKVSENTTIPETSYVNYVTAIDPSFGPSEPRILQVSMLFGEENKEIYRRRLETHFEHGKRWGYETHILQRAVRTYKYFLLNKSPKVDLTNYRHRPPLHNAI